VAVATPIAPLQHKPYGCVEELFQAGGVPMDSGVMVIPTECGVAPREPYWPPEVAVRLTPRGEARARGPELLPGGPAFAVIAPLAILAPPNLAPQNREARCSCLSVPTARDAPCRGA
jgi:hypothetical protein